MFQSDVPSTYHSNDRKLRKGDQKKRSLAIPNSLVLPEGEEVTATSLGNLTRDDRHKKIRRVPSVEEATATSLGNPSVTGKRKKINRKTAPNRLSFCSNNTNKEGRSMERVSYVTYSVGKGKEYSFSCSSNFQMSPLSNFQMSPLRKIFLY